MSDMLPFQLKPNSIAQSFSAAANTYDRVAVLQREVGQRILQRLDLVKLQPHRILDLGAGTGYFSRALPKHYPDAQIFGVDIAHGMLNVAHSQRGWFSRQHYVCANAHQLPFADGAFDFVFSNLMLHWCSDLASAMSEIFRVLRPEGLLMFSTLGPDTLFELRESWRHVDDAVHVNQFSDMHDVGDILLQQRFSDPVVDMEKLILTYPDAKMLMSELKSLGAHNVNQGRQRGLTTRTKMQKMLQAYEMFRNEQGVLPATYEVIYGHAWRPDLKPNTAGSGTAEVFIAPDQIAKRKRR